MRLNKHNKFSIWFFLFGASFNAQSANLDVYGASETLAKAIIADYGAQIYELEQKKTQLNIKFRDASSLQKPSQDMVSILKQKYHLSSVSIDTVYYPDTRKMYTTVNICDPKYTKGLNLGMPEQNFTVVKNPDVVDRMYLFIKKAVAFMILHPEYTHKMDCLDYHCITPEHPDVADDLAYFRGVVPKQQAFIERTIFKDPQLARRRAAIFLLGYFKNPEEIAKILNQVLHDDNSYIRHDALRVYGELYQKYPSLDVPVALVVNSIYSCNEAERNKALIFLNELASNPKYQEIMIDTAGTQLITLLRLKQPNNHNFAYQILQKLSHKPFNDQDCQKWEQWLTHVINKNT